MQTKNPCIADSEIRAYANIFLTREQELQELVLYDCLVKDKLDEKMPRRRVNAVSDSEWKEIVLNFKKFPVEYLRLLFTNIMNLAPLRLEEIAKTSSLHIENNSTLFDSGIIYLLVDTALTMERELDCQAFPASKLERSRFIYYLPDGMQISSPYSQLKFTINKTSMAQYITRLKVDVIKFFLDDKKISGEEISSEEEQKSVLKVKAEKNFSPRNICKRAYEIITNEIREYKKYTASSGRREKGMLESIMMQVMLQSLGTESYLLRGAKSLCEAEKKDIFFNLFYFEPFYYIFDPNMVEPFLNVTATRDSPFVARIREGKKSYLEVLMTKNNKKIVYEYQNNLSIEHIILR